MLLLSKEYSLLSIIDERKGSRLYRALRKSDGVRVILKVVASPDDEVSLGVTLRHEFEMLSRLSTTAVIRPIEYHPSARTGPSSEPEGVLILEDFGGDSLKNQLTKPMALADFFETRQEYGRGVGGASSVQCHSSRY